MNIKSKLAVVMLGISLAPASLYVSDFAISNAFAGADTKDIGVSASVPAVCNFATGITNVAFGEYDPTGANATTPGGDLLQTGTFDIRCTKGTAYTITMNGGNNELGGPSTTAPARRLTDGSSNYLNYQLYTDSGRTTTWSTATTNDKDGTATSAAPFTTTVYAKVPGAQTDAPVGTYTDTVTISVNY